MNTDVDTNQPTNMANIEQSPSVSWRNTIYCVQNIDEKYLKTKWKENLSSFAKHSNFEWRRWKCILSEMDQL